MQPYFDAHSGYSEEFELYDLSDKEALEYDNLTHDPAYAETRIGRTKRLQQQ